MSDQSEADRTPHQQATVWPPPPDNPFVEGAADPHQENSQRSQRYLNEAAFLFFLAVCAFPFLGILLLAAIRAHFPWIALISGLHDLWPVFYVVATYLGLRAILFARRAMNTGLQVQSSIITAASVLLALVFLFLP